MSEEPNRVPASKEVAKETMRAIGLVIQHIMPAGWAYCLAFFCVGEGGDCLYCATVRREDAIKALKELIGHLESQE